MRIPACFIRQGNDMPETPDDLARLRQVHYGLEDLPETIHVPQHPSRDAGALLAIGRAKIDDVAFAIIAAERDSAAAYRRCSALQRLYKLAREAGGTGTDPAVEAALRRERD